MNISKEFSYEYCRARDSKEENIKDLNKLVKKLQIPDKDFNANYFNSKNCIQISYIQRNNCFYTDKETGELIKFDLFKKFADDSLTPMDLLNETFLNSQTKFDLIFIYSFVISYYLNDENYNKVISILKDIYKKGYTIAFYPLDYLRENENNDSFRDNCLILRLCIAYCSNDDIAEKNNYISIITNNNSAIDIIRNNKFLLLLHKAVVKSFEGKELNKDRDSLNYFKKGSVDLDILESSTEKFKKFLSLFSKIYGEDTISDIFYRNEDTVLIKQNMPRIVDIFSNYLKSEYSIGRKVYKLKAILGQMNNFFILVNNPDYTLMNTLDGLPDKIQNEALKMMLGSL